MASSNTLVSFSTKSFPQSVDIKNTTCSKADSCMELIEPCKASSSYRQPCFVSRGCPAHWHRTCLSFIGSSICAFPLTMKVCILRLRLSINLLPADQLRTSQHAVPFHSLPNYLVDGFAADPPATPMDRYNQLRMRSIENAALLWGLTEFPDEPTENKMPSRNGVWTLLPERERQMAEDLAFIASTRDVSEEVIAVCLEENAEESRMVIRVASNAGDVSRAAEVLKSIAELMMKAAPRGMPFNASKLELA